MRNFTVTVIFTSHSTERLFNLQLGTTKKDSPCQRSVQLNSLLEQQYILFLTQNSTIGCG